MMASEEQAPAAQEDFVRITGRQYAIWKKRCSRRAKAIEKQLFEEKSFSDSEDEKEASTQDVKEDDKEAPEAPAVEKRSLFCRFLNYRLPETIDPYSDNVYLLYQVLVTWSFLYNAITIPMRMSFPIEVDENRKYWLAVDYLCDAINLVDMIVFQVRCQFIEGGNFKTERKDTRKHYMKSEAFVLDTLSLIPFEVLYLFVGFHPVLRVNRVLKYHSFFEFNNKFEMVLDNAYIYRVAVTTCYLLYFIHVDACLYYYTSYYMDFRSPWGFQNDGSSYIKCFYWAFCTTVTIGNVQKPTTNFELIFQLFNFFLGLFIFSIVIGQVRDSVQANAAEEEGYRATKNSCIDYMEKNNIPPHVQKKVREWFEYTWETQKILDESQLLNQIPEKMHNEIAVNVHICVMEKVDLFKGCDRQMLYDLVVKLRPILYMPGDYICRKGEVGREMYIISNGVVQVVGEKKSQIFVTLRAGTAFGEISLLALGGANRRTANIYSPGFATLFILLKNDLNDVVKNYPKSQTILKRKAKKLLNKDKDKRAAVTTGTQNSRSKPKKVTGMMGNDFLAALANEADKNKKSFGFIGRFRKQDKQNENE